MAQTRFLGNAVNAVNAEKERNLKIELIAAGLPRCATSSLREAFEKLGYAPCMHFDQVSPSAPRMHLVHKALSEPDRRKRQEVLFKIFEGYRSTADVPGAWFVQDLLEMYPDAKVILNTRDPDKWLKSIDETIGPATTKKMQMATFWHSSLYSVSTLYETWENSAHAQAVGTGRMIHRQTLIRHQDWVRGLMKKDGRGYIEWDPPMGWAPICELVEKPVPNEDFPHANDTAFMLKVHKLMWIIGALFWLRALAVPGLIFALFRVAQRWGY